VKLAVIATATGMLTVTVIVTETGAVKQGALCSKKFLVVSTTVFHQQRPS
jgi:hypothetical protein